MTSGRATQLELIDSDEVDDENGVKSTCVDVLFNPSVTERCWKEEGAPGLAGSSNRKGEWAW